VMRGKVIPLLAEYFYEDWERVRTVLNDKNENGCFIIREELLAPPASQNEEKRWRYAINDDEFTGYEAASE
jgi:5-methylcytosine-specific restriction enzyme B